MEIGIARLKGAYKCRGAHSVLKIPLVCDITDIDFS